MNTNISEEEKWENLDGITLKFGNGKTVQILERLVTQAVVDAHNASLKRVMDSVQPEASEHSPSPEATESLEGKDARRETTLPGQTKPPLTPQQVRQQEIAFDVSRKHAPGNARLQMRIIEAIDYAFALDAADREQMELTGATDEEFTTTKLGLRDGTIKLDTSWIE